jgi:hypothetical protein
MKKQSCTGLILLMVLCASPILPQEKKPQLINFQPCRPSRTNPCKKNSFTISWNVKSVHDAAGAIITRETDGKTATLGTFNKTTGSVKDSICETSTYHVVPIDKKRHKMEGMVDEISIPRGELVECK